MALTKVTSAVIKDATITDSDIGSTLTTAISGSFTIASSSLSSRITTNASNMTLATASIAAITASLGQPVNTDSNVTFNNINSTGTITATEIHTTFVSSSITVASGSNNFGDDTSDLHSFTGSLNVSGAINLNDGDAVFGATATVETGLNLESGTFTVKNATGDSNGLKISQGGSDASNILNHYNGTLNLGVANSVDMTLKGGNVGIGNTNPNNPLQIAYSNSSGTDYLDGDAGLYLANAGSDGTMIKFGDTNAGLVYGSSGNGTFKLMQRENTAVFIDASRRVAIGASAILTDVVGYNPLKLGVQGTSFSGGIYAIEHQNDISGGLLVLGKSRGTSAGAVTILQDNDIAGRLVFVGADGVDFRTNLAEIRATVNGTPGANSIPSELDFMVNDGLGNDAVQRMKIDAKGVLSTSSGSAVSYNAERTRNYQEGHTIVLDRTEVQTDDPTGNFDYHLMKQFVATKSGTLRMKWTAKNQSGAQYWGWLISRNYGFNTNQTPTGSDGSSGGQRMVLLDQGGSSLSNTNASFATGLDSGNSASVHAYRNFNVQVTDVVPGDTIGLWMKVTNGSGGVVEGTGQDLFCKDFEVLSVSPTIETNPVISGSITVAGDNLIGESGITKQQFTSNESYTDDQTRQFHFEGMGAIVIVTNTTSGMERSGLFFMDYASITTILVADPSSDFAASDSDNKICCFKGSGNSSEFSVKNRKGSTATLSVAVISNGNVMLT